MMHLPLGAVLLATAVGARAEIPPPASSEPAFKENAERTGRPSRIVPPEYPRQALRERRGGIVEASGYVSPFGVLEDARVTAVPPSDEAFAAAVRDVISDWLFYVPTDNSCMPDRALVTNRVEFTADDGEPHISVTRRVPSRESKPHFKALHRVNPGYPQSAVRNGVEATVYARINVDPEGKVSDVTEKAYSTSKSGVVHALEDEVRRTLLQWRFPPPDTGKSWTGCYTINFRLR